MNFDIKNPENLKGVDLIWIFEVLETLLGTQNWGISNLCSSGCKLGKSDSADKRGPLSAKERKKKRKRKGKRKGAGARFRLFIKPDKRDPRSATLVHVSRDQAKQEKLFKLSTETDTRSVRALWGWQVGPLVRLALSTQAPVRGRRKREGKKEGKGKKPSQLNSSWLQQEWTKPKTMERSIRDIRDRIERISGKLARGTKSQWVDRSEIGLIPRSDSVYISVRHCLNDQIKSVCTR